ncbi:hypothetical protein EVAR_26458_1 [Eumeta japonica]|uniref:Uncharacterized protein n=1 Tax=Eumeta variegata TaxID=151549 RepID=A0A4C1Z5R3_EUMVA|nr:hypothetical protein EVAR_26458_1 [Eumeta japonica]
MQKNACSHEYVDPKIALQMPTSSPHCSNLEDYSMRGIQDMRTQHAPGHLPGNGERQQSNLLRHCGKQVSGRRGQVPLPPWTWDKLSQIDPSRYPDENFRFGPRFRIRSGYRC